jgi:hypothetical protein
MDTEKVGHIYVYYPITMNIILSLKKRIFCYLSTNCMSLKDKDEWDKKQLYYNMQYWFFFTKIQKQFSRGGIPFPQVVLELLDIHKGKKWTSALYKKVSQNEPQTFIESTKLKNLYKNIQMKIFRIQGYKKTSQT